MTRATVKPVRRVVQTADGEMIAELTDRTLALRPLRTRRGGPSEIVVPWGAIYLRAMILRVEEARKAKKRKRGGR